MFKLPNPPSPRAEISELADFAEILSWRRGKVSSTEIVRYLIRRDENDGKTGIEHDEDRIIDSLEEVMNETGRRKAACKTGYPFEHDRYGSVLKRIDSTTRSRKPSVYIYLLLGTRLNMQNNRTHAGIDGAALLEEVSAAILKAYLGSRNCRTYVFGTSNQGGTFKNKIDTLCNELEEGVRFRNLNARQIHARDAGLDIVGWIPFEDRSSGQLIVFGQCKTGTEWRKHTHNLDPVKFNKLWMEEPFLVDPIRAYFVAEAVDRSNWKASSIAAGVLFDRCRLVEYGGCLSRNLLSSIRKWTSAAGKTLDL